MNNQNCQKITHVHFIGIGGISMSGLAEYLRFCGFVVSGSDVNESEILFRLRSKGVRIFLNHRAENIEGAQVVVYNSAINLDNPELKKAIDSNLLVVTRSQLLAYIMKDFKYSIAIAGSHGKTTATAMCMHALYNACGNATVHIGGEDKKFGNFYNGGKKFFITEACEFKRNFLQLSPSVSVLLNCDKDHLDCYENEKTLYKAFIDFVEKAPVRIVNKDDEIASTAKDAITFSLYDKSADFCAEDIKSINGKYSFSVLERGENICKIRLNAFGKHNVYNALAAFAVGRYYRFEPHLLAQGIEKFDGISRRFEYLGSVGGAEFIADYAHHPKEISAVISSAKEICKGRLFVVFQPHTYSRTKLLLDDFVSALNVIENLVVYKTYAAREYFDADGCAYTLSQSLPNSLYAESVKELAFYLKPVLAQGDIVLFLGAGDVYFVAKQLLKNLLCHNK